MKAVELANRPDFSVRMDLRPGEMQFINNYHVLHGRTAYEDDPANGQKRHLKRLWLAAHVLVDRPELFQAGTPPHWGSRMSVSNVIPVGRSATMSQLATIPPIESPTDRTLSIRDPH